VPEGDTIHRTAATLAKALVGRRIARAGAAESSATFATLEGATVRSVEARGKHLLIRFDDGRSLHTHMRMEGSWHLYRPGERWWHGAHRAVVVLESESPDGTAAWVAVCFDAPTVELVPAGLEPSIVQRLGPDLLDPAADLDEAVARLRALGALPLGEALLRQDAVAGIGNVYKSEVLFLRRLDPFAPLAGADDDTLRALLLEARRLMRRNLATRLRTTRARSDGRLWVYERSGQPCFECATPVRMRRQGESARSTYYCARCQSVG
jgi:endonuclease-8